MRKSCRPSTVVLSCLAVILGLLVLPMVGQGAPLTVLNWIPPTSFASGATPCDFFTFPTTTTCPTTSTAGAKVVTGTIPMWLGSDTSSVVYNFAMVGKDPSVAKTGATTIDTKIIPIVFTGSASGVSYVFDPENNDACSPRKTPALNMVQSSPVFKTNKLVLGGVGGVSLGTYQFGSQFQRANFATYTIKTTTNTPVSPNYDISLQQVLVNTEEKSQNRIALGATTPAAPQTLPYTIQGQVLANSGGNSDWCDPLALIEVNDFDSLLQNQIIPSLKGNGITPTTLPIFLLSNVVMYESKVDPSCCILSYHNAYLSLTTGATAGKLQTYIVANYDTTGGTVNSGTPKAVSYTGAFPKAAPNIVALANAVAGWIDNPTTLNPTPPWPSSTSRGTERVLEVAYPQCPSPPPTPPLRGNLTTIPMPKFTYSVQDLAFKSWFYNDMGSANTGFNGQFSMFGNLPVSCPP